jgi:tungstate transport system substrate-binding protein
MKRLVAVTLCLVSLVLFAAGAGCAPAPAPTAAPTAVPAKPTSPPAAPTTAPAAAPTAAPAVPTAAPAAPTATLPAAKPPSPGLLRLATTTSTADTGLLTAILPLFEKANNVKVDVVAVGSGQAIEIGSKGDADVLLVHSRAAEDKFVTDGHAKARFDVMYNDFILVGPKEDPARAASTSAAKDAFKAIMDAKAVFVSRGDKSGTNTKELGVWNTLGITPTKDMAWYNSIGQGMGDTLLFSNEKKGYTLTDRGTWLAMKDKLPALVIILGGNTLAENKDKTLLNPYGVLAVDPVKHPASAAIWPPSSSPGSLP